MIPLYNIISFQYIRNCDILSWAVLGNLLVDPMVCNKLQTGILSPEVLVIPTFAYQMLGRTL